MPPATDAPPPWRDVLGCLPSPVAVLDADGAVVAASSGFTRLLDVDDPRSGLREVVAIGQQGPLEIDLTSRSGADLRCRVRPVRREGSPPTWFVLQVQDPDAGARDELTGLVTRDALVVRLRQALAHRQRHGGEVEVLVVDVDRFKRVNDTHGHVVGDEVLVEVARRLEAVSRPEDTVCRWGGDEFVLLVADLPQPQGPGLCQRVETALRRPYRTSHAVALVLSASCGSVRATGDEDPVDLMHQADLLMYERKRAHHAAEGEAVELTARLARAHARARALHHALDDTMRRVTSAQERPRTTARRWPDS